MVNTRRMMTAAAAAAMIVMASIQPAAAEVVDRIVAIVNNEIITLSELNTATRSYRQNIEASQNSEERKKELISQLEKDMLQKLVENSLTVQEAEKFGIKVSDEDIDIAVENFKKANNLDEERLERGLAAEGLTMEEYRDKMKSQIRQTMLVNRAVRSKIIITDEEVAQYYDAHKDEFQGNTKYRLRNILTRKKTEMDTVMEKLKSGVAFGDLAKVYSIGSNAPEGGELGLFDISSFSEEIREAVQPLKKGEHTPVLNTGSTFQIIFVEDIESEGDNTLEQAKEKIQNILYRAQGEKLFKKWMASLKENAHIKLML
ncbi:MAG: SurA N-terminal domain-containing protein [Desulfobacter sp.]|nr:MAG: SurA N-terminal domain-containing protein [Desulfobacter sp.]